MVIVLMGAQYNDILTYNIQGCSHGLIRPLLIVDNINKIMYISKYPYLSRFCRKIQCMSQIISWLIRRCIL